MKDRRDILSVDIEALIRKRSAYTFRSPHHYPVELVRDAARRGATEVSLRFSHSRVEIADDGAPHTDEELQAMAILLDPEARTPERVSAMDRFETLRGLGLLAAIAPGPSRLHIERAESSPGELEYRPGTSPTLVATRHHRNRILIERRGQPAEERRIVRDWCRWARLRITVDGEEIGGREAPPHLGLTQIRGETTEASGLLWLPISGEACRVRLLDQGIQWRLAAYEPDHGLLYEAAVESPEIPPGKLRSRLRALALDLYVRAMEARPSLPPDGQDRLDELVFLHHRRTDSRHLMGSYSPFQVAGTTQLLNLDSIRDRAATGAIAALTSTADPEHYSLEDREALLLTPRQWDYLEEHAGVPLVPPPKRPRRRGLLRRALGDLGRTLRRMAGSLLIGSPRPIRPEDMEPGEAALVEGFAEALRTGRCYLPGLEGLREVQVVLVAGGTWRPAAVINTGSEPTVALHRANRDVKRAARAVGEDEDLIYLALPLLFNGHDGWV